MNLSDYHAKYFAHELTRRYFYDSLEKLAGAVASAQVDLNPHQIDEHTFANFKSCREHFSNLDHHLAFQMLKDRLKPISRRTQRRQVTAYVRFTRRFPFVKQFAPEESEDRLYNLVSDYLRRDNLEALHASQCSPMTLVLRKLLASSTFAIAGRSQVPVVRSENRRMPLWVGLTGFSALCLDD